MQKHSFHFPVLLVGVAVLISGCAATAPPRSEPEHISQGPQIFLNGARLQEARSLAMGSAATKGWKIVDASDNKLLVKRPLKAATARAAIGAPVSSASVEVRTDFVQRRGGVEVTVGATAIADRGGEKDVRIDFTDRYRAELERSLDSLRQSWEVNGSLVAATTPPMPRREASPADDDSRQLTPAMQAWKTAAAETQHAVPERPRTTSSETTAPAKAPVETARTLDKPAPVENRSTTAAPHRTAVTGGESEPIQVQYAVLEPPLASTDGRTSSPRGDAPQVGRGTQPGIWAYYAEYYAKGLDCQVADRGAVLEQKSSHYEIHRVYCENMGSVLVKCSAGTCVGIQ